MKPINSFKIIGDEDQNSSLDDDAGHVKIRKPSKESAVSPKSVTG